MQSVFVRRGAAILVLLTILAVSPAAFADDGSPQARIQPPIGVAEQPEEPSLLDLFLIWLQAKIGPPGG